MINFQSPQTKLKELVFVIDETIIPVSNITNLKIDYNIESEMVNGEFKIECEFDIGKLAKFKGELPLSIKGKDICDFEMDEKFIIYEFSSVRDKPNYFIADGKFVDVVSYKLSKKRISKSFKDKKLSDILQDEKIGKEIFTQTNKKTEFNDEELIENYTISANANLLDVIKTLKGYSNCYYFHTHEKIKIQPLTKLYKNSILEIKGHDVRYESPPQKPVPFLDVMEYKIIPADGEKLSKYGAKVKAFTYNPLKRNVKPIEYDLEKANKDLGNLNDEIKTSTEGEKMVYIPFYAPETQIKNEFQKHILFGSRLMILSSGYFFINVGETIPVLFQTNEGNVENISGDYLITRVTDVIKQGFLNQKVELTRPSPAKSS